MWAFSLKALGAGNTRFSSIMDIMPLSVAIRETSETCIWNELDGRIGRARIRANPTLDCTTGLFIMQFSHALQSYGRRPVLEWPGYECMREVTMAAEVIDGRAIAAAIREELKERIDRLHGLTPGLAAVAIGDDPAAASYLKGIARGCEAVGIHYGQFNLPVDVSQRQLEQTLTELNANALFHGIILQLPLPKHLDALRAESVVSPGKDIDGTNPVSAGRLLLGEQTFFPSTAHGVQQLLVRSGHSPGGTTRRHLWTQQHRRQATGRNPDAEAAGSERHRHRVPYRDF